MCVIVKAKDGQWKHDWEKNRGTAFETEKRLKLQLVNLLVIEATTTTTTTATTLAVIVTVAVTVTAARLSTSRLNNNSA